MIDSLGFKEKGVALRASATVVSVASFVGKKLFFACSGTIIECEDIADGSFVNTILTTASLLRCSTCHIPSLIDSDTILEDMKIEVILADGSLFEGNIIAYDFHFNVALIKFISYAIQQSLHLRNIEDSESVDPSKSDSTYQLHPHSELYQIRHGDMVVILGRHGVAPYEFDAYSGTFSIDHDLEELEALDCQELFITSCDIAQCCVGGPVVSQHGELIGVAFGGYKCTPFLPINIASLCLEYIKRYGKLSRPYVGMDSCNLNAAAICYLEKFLHKFPDTVTGVFVKWVEEDSPAHHAGILQYDVIIGCNGSSVGSYLEFMGKLFDKVGESVELVVLRASNGAVLSLSMVVDETSPNNVYRWPLPQSFPSERGGKPIVFFCCDYDE